jgi:hypothetical protein
VHRAADQMLPPAYPARVSNIDHRRSKKNPVRMAVFFQDGAQGRGVFLNDASRRRRLDRYQKPHQMTVRCRTLDIRFLCKNPPVRTGGR